MFKQAYVRGVTNALIQSGHVAFPDEESATKVADFIAEHTQFDPATPNRDVTLKIANNVIEASKHLEAQGFKGASVTLKVATVEDLGKLAHAHVIHLMEKAAEGSTIEGGDKGNAESNSAEGKMDASQRPPGYAENSLGTSAVDTRPGAVGKEQVQPNAPSESPAGSNSITDASKSAATLEALIKKVAEGTTILGGDKGNTEPTTAEGKMDASQRPPGYAVLPSQGDLGELMQQVSSNAVVGRETPHPNGPAESPSGSNSVIEHSSKAAAEDPYIAVFKKTAAEVVPHLPASFNDDTKVAHVRACMGMTQLEKAHYLVGLKKEAADKTAARAPATQPYQGYDGKNANQRKVAELPAFLQGKVDEKKDDDKKDDDKKDSGGAFPGAAPPFGKKDDDKGEKKDDEEKKEASLVDFVRRVAASITPAA
jgi:hypothetical protein